MSYLTHEQILAMLGDTRLSRVSADLAKLLQPAIRLQTHPCDLADLPLGATRIGGHPDVPADFPWPVGTPNPLWFLAQIHLPDLRVFPWASLLPQEGWLLFFYDADTCPWGFAPSHRGGWAVVYLAAENAPLHRWDQQPAEAGGPPGYFPCCRVEMVEIFTPIDFAAIAFDRLHLTSVEEDTYLEVMDAIAAQPGPAHQLLGHPQPLQQEMQLDCQLVSHGIDLGGAAGYEDPRVPALAATAEQWRLLLQLDSDEQTGMMWGDVGRLYFWIPEPHLLQRNFAASWALLQCT